MANYDIFDEQYYLSQYGFVKDAVAKGLVKSGLEHFQKYGQAAGLTKVSRYFDEDTYLAQNPEIASLARTTNNQNATFASGLDHFIQYGYEQGRINVSPEYNEDFYLANNRDLLPFIQNGTFKSGYQHLIKYGSKEGRFGTSFFEPEYLKQNPGLGSIIASGALKTGRDHYFRYGQFEPNRSATFVGSSGNDIITGVGVGNVEIIGVEVGVEYIYGARNYESKGSNEFDTLIGGSGHDKFVLGDFQTFARNLPSPISQLYLGPGFATIQNFTKGQDSIQLEGFSLDQYILFPINNNQDLAIQTNGLSVFQNGANQTSRADTIAVIQGGGNLSLNLLPGSGGLKILLG